MDAMMFFKWTRQATSVQGERKMINGNGLIPI